MKIDETLSLTNEEFESLPIDTQKEIWQTLRSNSFLFFCESVGKNYKFPFEPTKFPCIINGWILY